MTLRHCPTGLPLGSGALGVLERVADAQRYRQPEAGTDGTARELGLRRPYAPFCRAIAEHFDVAPARDFTPEVDAVYRRFASESVANFEAVVDAGIHIYPWTGLGQPYRDSRELISRVRATGELFVYLTAAGHGPGGIRPPVGRHPLRAPAGVTVDGVELVVNDVVRATHDLFGHVVPGHGFDVTGELAAARAHGMCHSADSRRALFTEQVGQISWFFFGPHLLERAVAPGDRPYPDQKVFLYPDTVLSEFDDLFTEECP